MKRRTLVLVLLLGWQTLVSGEVRYRVVRIDPPEPVGQIGVRRGVVGIGALDINADGSVVGRYQTCVDDNCHTLRESAFTYSDADGCRRISVPGYEFASAEAVNDSGQVALTVRKDPTSPWEMFRYSPGLGFEPIEGLGGWESDARAINASGQIAGGSEPPFGWGRAFRTSPGGSTEFLGDLSGFGSDAFGINDHGWVVGGSAGHAFLFRDDQGMLDLGPGTAYGINNTGVVAGRFIVDEGNPGSLVEACLWENGALRLLGRWAGLLGGGGNAAHDINNFKVVVGYVVAPTVHATIWTEAEGMVELEPLLEPGVPGDPSARWHPWTANAINDHGQIVGSGALSSSRWDDALLAVTFRLDPIPPRLAIERTSTNAVVRWAPAWPGLVLESSASLSTPDWQPVATGGTNVVTVSATGPQRFFRLNLEGIRGLCCAPE